MVAGEPDSGRAWTLAARHQTPGAEELAVCLAEELASLPYPQAIRSAITHRDHATRAVVREALAMASSSASGLVARMVAGERHDPAAGEIDPFVGAVAQPRSKPRGAGAGNPAHGRLIAPVSHALILGAVIRRRISGRTVRLWLSLKAARNARGV